jgi:sulfate adenylyltransferase subunit 2
VITRIKFLEQTRPIVTSYQSENPILQSALEAESMNTPERSKSELLVSSQLLALEAESIHIIREVVAEFEKPGLLFSGGKDSIVMLHLAVKALRPAKLPFPIVHIDTGHNFPEAIEYRDRTAENLGIDLIVGSVQETLDNGGVQASTLPAASRNRLQTPVLLKTISNGKFDAVFGGARRDEERARAKKRVYSFKDEFGQWDPKNQRPELWNLYNGFTNTGQHIRVFPLSNWTELDIWQYIFEENIELPSIYFAHEREVFERDGMLMVYSEFLKPENGEKVFTETAGCRFSM